MDSTVLVAAFALASPLLLAALINWQRRKEKAEDRIQAAKEKTERDEVAAQAAADRTAAEKRQDDVAEQAAEVARVLLEAERTNVAAALGEASRGACSAIVALYHPNGERQEVLLAGVPREGDHIRLNNGRGGPALIVEYVLWVQGETSPVVVVVIAPNDGQVRPVDTTPG